ncbi:hypothetical protein ACM66B_000758 [Microbotryomycetes sp. NB124-2]
MRHAYRPPARSATTSSGLAPPRLVTEDDGHDSDDDDTAVATDLSALPPAPAQTFRAGFMENPVSDQVFFDEREAPAAVAPIPRPALRPTLASNARSTSLPTFAIPSSATRSPLAKPQVASRSMSLNPVPMSSSSQRLRRPPRQPQSIISDEDERDSDDDTIVPESEGDTFVTDSTFEAPRLSRPTMQPPLAPSLPPPAGRRFQQPPAQQRQQQIAYVHEQASYYEEAESSVGYGDDDDSSTAIGTGVATDLSLDELNANLDYQRQYAQPCAPSMHSYHQHRQRSVQQEIPWTLANSYRPPSPLDGIGSLRQELPFSSYTQASPTSVRSKPVSASYGASSRGSVTPATDARAMSPQRPIQPKQASSFQQPHATSEVSTTSYSSISSASTATSGSSSAQETKLERELILLLKEMNFSIALKDLHDQFNLGVQKTLVTEDGHGHAYVKVHCRKLLKEHLIAKEDHFSKHWVCLGGTRWEFRTDSHRITVIWKTTGVGDFEVASGTARR